MSSVSTDASVGGSAAALRDFVAAYEGQMHDAGLASRQRGRARSAAAQRLAANAPRSVSHPFLAISLSNREGIDNWRLVHSKLRRSFGREIAPVRSLLSLQTLTVDWNH